MTVRSGLVAIAAVAALNGCATDPNAVPRSQQLWTARGPSVTCITTSRIRSTHVVDDRAINFVVNSRQMFRNELPFSCPGLSFNRSFKHNSRSGQLCSASMITVMQPGGMRGPGCSLGRFQPMVPVPPAATPAG